MNFSIVLRCRNLRSRCRTRRGLAPLEFVLWLPILLFVMALMVNYGNSAAWRVRGEIVSRDAAWRSRWPRLGDQEPPPNSRVWPNNATINSAGAAQYSPIDDGRIQHPVVRGPLPNGFSVTQRIAPLQGAIEGTSSITRRYPLLPQLGSFDSGQIRNSLLDLELTNRYMGIPNVFRRTEANGSAILYRLPWPDRSPFNQVVNQVQQIPDYDWLAVIDPQVANAGDDWLTYQPFHHMGKPDFHPRIRTGLCSLDQNRVYQQEVQRIVDRRLPTGRWRLGAISTLPRRLTAAYLGMFRRTEQEMLLLQMDPMTPPATLAFIAQHLPIVRQHIQELQNFQQQIQGFENSLVNRP